MSAHAQFFKVFDELLITSGGKEFQFGTIYYIQKKGVFMG